ncbi:guanine-1-methyltransferase-domain-containing protein [Aspergillus venezuelensis]
MEEEERPRKMQKLETGEELEPEPLMTGAIDGAQDNAQADVQHETPTTTTEKAAEEPSTATAPAESESAEPKLSKRQQKRQAAREFWEAGRESRKILRKQKNAERKERKRALWDEAKAAGKDPTAEVEKQFPTTTRKLRGRRSTKLPLTLIIDCGFDELMMPKERMSLGQQITRSYSENTKSEFNTHMVVSSFDKLLKERFETVLHNTHKSWKGIRFVDEDWLHAANQAKEFMQGERGGKLAGPFEGKADAKPEDGEIVYLSSDSSETLTELKPYSTYIIGGLVDKNRHKGICHKQATEMGIRTAKLPIGEYIQMSHRSVLATNHVVEIMVRWLQSRDWAEAFMRTLPPRKGGVRKDVQQDEGGETPQDGDAEVDGETGAAPENGEGADVDEVPEVADTKDSVPNEVEKQTE